MAYSFKEGREQAQSRTISKEREREGLGERERLPIRDYKAQKRKTESDGESTTKYTTHKTA